MTFPKMLARANTFADTWDEKHAVFMKNPALDGTRSKIERANYHLEQIDIAIGQIWAAERQNSAESHPCHKMEGMQLIVFRPHSTPVDPSLSLMVGDFIHNTRSALDHLVFQLAVLNCAPPESAKKTAFPVFLDAKEFKGIRTRRLVPFISSPAVAEIEKLQPYASGRREKDLLWVLSQLDIIDKHRLLIITKMKMQPTGFTMTTASGEQATMYLPVGEWKPAEAGTELLRFDLSGSSLPQGELKVQIQTAMTIQIEKSGLVCDGTVIQAVLHDCIQHTADIIDSFGRMFFSE